MKKPRRVRAGFSTGVVLFWLMVSALVIARLILLAEIGA
jgi:hypothetical protein